MTETARAIYNIIILPYLQYVISLICNTIYVIISVISVNVFVCVLKYIQVQPLLGKLLSQSAEIIWDMYGE